MQAVPMSRKKKSPIMESTGTLWDSTEMANTSGDVIGGYGGDKC